MKKNFILLVLLGITASAIAQDETINGQLKINVSDKNTLRLENDSPGQEASIRLRSKNLGGYLLHADISLYSNENNNGFLGFKVPHNNDYGLGYQMVINSSGNLGLGTVQPLINIGNSGFQIDKGGHSTILIGDGVNNGGVIQSSDNSRRIFIGSNMYDDPNLSWKNFTDGKSAAVDVIGNSGLIRFITSSSSSGYAYNSSLIRMSILDNGNVGIGTEVTGNHKLAVEGSIGAREIQVEANGWSDFVFEDSYQLKSLEETEQFIIENKHLPDIPSESEILNNGINLGDMDSKLLQKIEELTLYVIEQNKLNKTQQEKIEQLEIELNNLKEK